MAEQIIKILSKYGDVYLSGLGGTLWLALVTVLIGTLVGTIVALLKMVRFKPIGWIVSIYIEVLRGTPILLQLYFFWLLLPKIIPAALTDTQCVVTALIVNSSAYVSEIIRAGIQAVDIGQREAAMSLGLTGFHTFSKVILPQAVKNILPALGNEFIVMVKETSLASVFFVNELTTSYKTIQSATFLSIPSLTITGLIYLAINFVLSKAVAIAERRLKAGDR